MSDHNCKFCGLLFDQEDETQSGKYCERCFPILENECSCCGECLPGYKSKTYQEVIEELTAARERAEQAEPTVIRLASKMMHMWYNRSISDEDRAYVISLVEDQKTKAASLPPAIERCPKRLW